MSNSTPTLKTDSDGTRCWTLDGKLHRTDGPAIEYADGGQEWYLHGELHRTDGPAFERYNGDKAWYINGNRHRIDGPAVEWADGDKEWWVNGQLHRTDGPAIEWSNGHQAWWVNGQEIYVPYSHMLTAAFNRGLPIPEEAILEIAKATREALTSGEQIVSLKTILDKYWPMHIHKILATLLSDPDPTIKHIAFSLLGRGSVPKAPRAVCASSSSP